MFQSVLIANRGAVARRVIRSLRASGIRSVALYSEADADLPHVREADAAVCIGPASPRESYLNIERILEVAREQNVDAIHPGYGFLSESAGFAERAIADGRIFIGPAPRHLREMGEKTQARSIMARHGMPISAGTQALPDDIEDALKEALGIGFPVLIKPAGGGGGIGMIAAATEDEFRQGLSRARSLCSRNFGNSSVYLEKLLIKPRHIELQILSDNYGEACHLFERDCSLQRRNQKVIEEARAPLIDDAEISAVGSQAIAALKGLGYNNIGTVELLRSEDGSYNFLEMNTRLQVEHAVTEEITGVDLVGAQIRLAAGAHLTDVITSPIRAQGHALEVRVYAEDPRTFLPSPGVLTTYLPPTDAGVRVETGYEQGNVVTPYYDPMLAKLIVHRADRAAAIEAMIEALEQFEIAGIKSNIPFLLKALNDGEFQAGRVHTQLAATLV